jgi:phospholipid/cholesterol/gamma-HCH transport system permease protein
MRKLVVPRMLAGFLMTPVLTAISDFVGIAGGWVVARFQLQVNSGLYWSSVREGLYLQDVYGMGLVKPFVFGFIIVTVACHVGMRTSGGTAGVGRATTVAVVAGSVLVIAADFFVNQILVTLLY